MQIHMYAYMLGSETSGFFAETHLHTHTLTHTHSLTRAHIFTRVHSHKHLQRYMQDEGKEQGVDAWIGKWELEYVSPPVCAYIRICI